MNTPPLSLNWYAGWWLVLAAFVTGAGIGMFFHRENFLGGYGSFRRRMLRLGHIACAALGMLNLIFALGPCASRAASLCFVVGGVAMPVVCFLTAWREKYRLLFLVPVLSLMAAVVMMLIFPTCHSEPARNLKLPARMDSTPTSDVGARRLGMTISERRMKYENWFVGDERDSGA